jgi:quinol monooxygenase YgiN
MRAYAQHTVITAVAGRRDELVEKFLQAAELQGDNPACLATTVGIDPMDVRLVYLTEFWTSEAEHTAATQSPAVQEWADGMAELVDGPPDSTRFVAVGGRAQAR